MRRSAISLLFAASLLAIPASAGAAGVTAPQTCFISSADKGYDPIPFTASGLTPGQGVTATLVIDGAPSGTGTAVADASGNATAGITWTSTFGGKPSNGEQATINLTDSASGAPLATTPVTVGNAGFSVEGGVKKLSAGRKWKISGLSTVSGGSTYYAYYFKPADVKKNRFKVVAKQKLGAAKGPCGYTKASKPLVPGSRTGKYVLVIETSPKWDPKAMALSGTVTVTRV